MAGKILVTANELPNQCIQNDAITLKGRSRLRASRPVNYRFANQMLLGTRQCCSDHTNDEIRVADIVIGSCNPDDARRDGDVIIQLVLVETFDVH